jgi:quercetin dioxygenase-like cupin family protein
MSETGLGPVGQRVIFENDLVRVWEIVLQPGETQPLHRHDLPYVVISVQSAVNVIESADGERIDVTEPRGAVVFREPGATHSLTNVGETTYVARLLEIKNA